MADNNRQITTTIYKKDNNGNAKKDKGGNPIVLKNRTLSAIYTLPNQPIKVIYRSDGSGTSITSQASLTALPQKSGQRRATTHSQLPSQATSTLQAISVALLELTSHKV